MAFGESLQTVRIPLSGLDTVSRCDDPSCHTLRASLANTVPAQGGSVLEKGHPARTARRDSSRLVDYESLSESDDLEMGRHIIGVGRFRWDSGVPYWNIGDSKLSAEFTGSKDVKGGRSVGIPRSDRIYFIRTEILLPKRTLQNSTIWKL